MPNTEQIILRLNCSTYFPTVPKCAPFVGKVIVDDVWSGGTAEEAKEKGYLLMSECIKDGLYHPNCQDSHTTYFGDIEDEEDEEETEEQEQTEEEQIEETPETELEEDEGKEISPTKEPEYSASENGVDSTVPTSENQITPQEQRINEQLYNAEQRQNYCERQVQRFERMGKYSLDKDNQRIYRARKSEWKEKLAQVKESVQNFKKSIAKSAESGIINTEYVLARKERNTGAFSELEIPMQKRYVLYLCQKYGIDTNGIKFKIQRSEELVNLGYFGMTDYDNIGRIDLLPNAFRNEEQLLRTIIHEKCHVKQLKKYGKKYVQDNLDEMERVAYKFEDFYYSIVKRRTNL